MDDATYQSIGNKGIHRDFLSVSVLTTIGYQKELFKSVRLGIGDKRAALNYANFVAEFYGLFHATWLFTNDVTLVKKIQTFMSSDTDLKFSIKNANTAVSLFSDYLIQMKAAGIYDPAIFKAINSPKNAWTGSI